MYIKITPPTGNPIRIAVSERLVYSSKSFSFTTLLNSFHISNTEWNLFTYYILYLTSILSYKKYNFCYKHILNQYSIAFPFSFSLLTSILNFFSLFYQFNEFTCLASSVKWDYPDGAFSVFCRCLAISHTFPATICFTIFECLILVPTVLKKYFAEVYGKKRI